MSGLAVVRGEGSEAIAQRMMDAMAHRGGYLRGSFTRNGTTVAQNYLQADCPLAPTDADVPVALDGAGDVRVCFDGQIGNLAELAERTGCKEGAFLAERVLLALWREKGEGMLEDLTDAVFALAIVDGERLFVARDVFGIRTLFYDTDAESLRVATELKSFAHGRVDVHEFPAGHHMDAEGNLRRYADIPSEAPELLDAPLEEMIAEIRRIIDKSIRARVDFARPTACLLSGGMDSSVISALTARLCRERFGDDAKIKTYAIGSKDSSDLPAARQVSQHVGTDHEEILIDLDDLLEAVPEVIRVTETFDPSLVRSSVSNFLISRHAAKAGFEVLMSGEGGDELFCGYAHLKSVPYDELFGKQMDLLRYLHNNASLRLDRTNQANGIRVITPLISGELFDYVIRIPMEHKMHTEPDGTKVEKWIFRKAYEPDLPREITERLKQEFSQGSGAAALLPGHFEQTVPDEEFEAYRREHPIVRNKEEMQYHRLFLEHFGDKGTVETVGQWKFK
jgi:asparagine synthase (glutamine-hydrolysing)